MASGRQQTQTRRPAEAGTIRPRPEVRARQRPESRKGLPAEAPTALCPLLLQPRDRRDLWPQAPLGRLPPSPSSAAGFSKICEVALP